MRSTVIDNQRRTLLGWKSFDAARLQWKEAIYPPAGSEFFVGPAFRVLKQTSLQGDRIYGRIQAPSLIELSGTHRDVTGWRTPSAVLDACLFATGILAWNRVRPGINLPLSFDAIVIHRLPIPGEFCWIESRWVRNDERSAWFDFSVWGSDQTLRLEATVLSYGLA